jgi:hypothetical protein
LQREAALAVAGHFGPILQHPRDLLAAMGQVCPGNHLGAIIKLPR